MSEFSLKALRRWLPARPTQANKRDFGHVLIVAGSRGMTGAAVLAARAALRSGCGLVTVGVAENQQAVVAGQLVEAMTVPLPATSSGGLRAEAAGVLKTLHRHRGFTVMALGPGLGLHAETSRAVIGLLGTLPVPAVVDADALNVLALQPGSEVRTLLSRREAPCVFTPHPGELARLLRVRSEEVSREREKSARQFCSCFGGVCLLKGWRTVVTDGARVWVNTSGSNALAKGGTGDALTGLIAGLWSQRLRAARRAAAADDDGFEAAALGAFLHGHAAEHAAREKTAYATTASDAIEALPAAFRKLA